LKALMSAPFGRLTSDAPRTAHEAPALRAREAQIIVALLGGDAQPDALD
jgi:hypothetical protein